MHKREKRQKELQLPSEVQSMLNMLAFNFIVAEVLPLSTIESVHLRNLLKEVDSRADLCCLKTLKLTVVKEFLKFKEEMKNFFNAASSVCLTADIWGSKK